MCGGMVKMGLSFILVSLLLASVALTYSFSRVGEGVHLKAITLKEIGKQAVLKFCGVSGRVLRVLSNSFIKTPYIVLGCLTCTITTRKIG